MAALTPQEIYALANKYFGDLGPEVVAAQAATVMGESGGNPSTHNNQGEDSRGLNQINIGPGANTDLAGYDLFDPDQNFQAARIVYDRQGPNAWSVFSSGKYKQYLPQFTSVAGASEPPQSQQNISLGSQTMTSQYPNQSYETLIGYQIPLLAAQIANMGAQNEQALAGLSGYINPATMGYSSGIPTLARDMFEDAKAQADRQYTLDVAQFGLQQATLKYQQRMGEAQVKLDELGLLASQRGLRTPSPTTTS
jgi:hypothetical protein